MVVGSVEDKYLKGKAKEISSRLCQVRMCCAWVDETTKEGWIGEERWQSVGLMKDK